LCHIYLYTRRFANADDAQSASPNGTGGRIIFVSATLHYAGTLFQAPASAAKAGVDSLAVSVAMESGPRGVTSNVIAPGAIANTEGVDRLARKEARERGEALVPR
jgi:2,4-dienoyl-CoA reductase [(3E)-enoyl-CoA-producing], peroxisomal